MIGTDSPKPISYDPRAHVLRYLGQVIHIRVVACDLCAMSSEARPGGCVTACIVERYACERATAINMAPDKGANELLD